MNNQQYLIDSHHHLWQLDGHIRYPWLSDQVIDDFFLGDYVSIRQTFLPTHLQQLIPSGYRLLGSIHCEAEADRQQSCDETAWIDAIQINNRLPCAHIGWAPFGKDHCANWLDRQMQSSLFRGVRVKPLTAKTAEEYDRVKGCTNTLQDPGWCSGLALLEERDLSWDLRVPAWHLADAAKTLKKTPGLRVILNHCGLPWERSQSGLANWRQQMEILASNLNVCVKLSELGVPGTPWNTQQNFELLCQTISIFGTKRCLFASNMPVSGLQVSYADWLALVEQAIRAVDPTARDDILWRNALHWYRLDTSLTDTSLFKAN
ncbi:amidohydrolase family protein [Aliamphritea hakodatensis]|uniref:amidohydrolase family protein n=1 Tax=Aliamphritea hakodatensis TaxID=2895352 RepID=UPI0022FD796B|nr:amidohydrolase family protein [Aliamphritea hakodatensis]